MSTPGSTASDTTDSKLPFVLAITGASGAIYGLRLLQYLAQINQPVDLLISNAAVQVMHEENDITFGRICTAV